MINPVFRSEFNYSLTPEFPLPLSFSKLIHFDFPNSSLRRGAGSWKPEIPPSLPFLCLDEPGGLRNLEILSALHPPGQSWKPEAGNWKFPPTSEWPGANARRKLEARNSSPVWLPTPEAGSWKFDSRSLERDQQDNIPQQSD